MQNMPQKRVCIAPLEVRGVYWVGMPSGVGAVLLPIGTTIELVSGPTMRASRESRYDLNIINVEDKAFALPRNLSFSDPNITFTATAVDVERCSVATDNHESAPSDPAEPPQDAP